MKNNPAKSSTATTRTIQGEVVRRSGDKTIAVLIRRVVAHPIYKKRSSVSKKYLVHDEKNEAAVGDTVVIMSSRPRSARKRWTLVSIIPAK